jgi:hypothetical protein
VSLSTVGCLHKKSASVGTSVIDAAIWDTIKGTSHITQDCGVLELLRHSAMFHWGLKWSHKCKLTGRNSILKFSSYCVNFILFSRDVTAYGSFVRAVHKVSEQCKGRVRRFVLPFFHLRSNSANFEKISYFSSRQKLPRDFHLGPFRPLAFHEYYELHHCTYGLNVTYSTARFGFVCANFTGHTEPQIFSPLNYCVMLS